MLWKRLTYLLPSRRRAAELDMQEELRSIAAMAQPGELGNLTVAAEDARAEWGWTRLDAVVQDFRYALRTLWKSRGFSAVAILSLGLGIGANTALFSLVDALLLRSLPIHEPDRVVSVSRVAFELGKKPTGIDAPKLDALRRLDTTFSGVAVASSLGRPVISIDGHDEPTLVAMQATGNLFRLLGVGAAVGRVETTSPGLVLGDRYWRTRFQADRSALGKSIVIDGVMYPVVGVAPPRFGGLSLDGSVDIWLLAPPTPVVSGIAHARLQPGVTIDQALAAADGVFRQLERDGFVPIFNGVPVRLRTEVQPAGQGNSSLRNQYQKPLLALMALVALVLLMTCTNVGSLVIVRNSSRARELAVRAALGARRSRLIAQLSVESVVLAAAAAVVAWLVARWGVAILLSMLPVPAVPEQLEFHTNLRVLASMAGISFASAALFTLAPAWRAATVALIPALTTSQPAATSRGARRLGAWFVAGQTALSVVLLAGALLFLQSARNAMSVGPGFDADNLLQVELERDWVRAAAGPNGRRAPYTAEQIRAAYAALEERLLAVPGVRAVTSSWIPVLPPHFVGQPQPPDPAGAFVGPRFFETLGIPIIRGRGLVDEDAMSNGAAGVVISDSLARELFPGEDAVGKIVPSIRVRNGLFRNLQVVGIAADARLNNLRWEVDPTLYLTASSTTRPMTALQVRTSINAARVAPQVRQAIVDMDPRALVSVRSMDDSINRSIARERMVAATSAFFGIVGLVLAGIGVFGVAASAVAQRTKELGLRIALGATPLNVIRESLRDTMWVFGLGLAVGTAAAFAAARAAGSLVSGLLFGLSATDWTNVAAAALLMVAVGAFACLMPAIRATRVDPLVALRHE